MRAMRSIDLHRNIYFSLITPLSLLSYIACECETQVLSAGQNWTRINGSE